MSFIDITQANGGVGARSNTLVNRTRIQNLGPLNTERMSTELDELISRIEKLDINQQRILGELVEQLVDKKQQAGPRDDRRGSQTTTSSVRTEYRLRPGTRLKLPPPGRSGETEI